jgi:hypothetical protein
MLNLLARPTFIYKPRTYILPLRTFIRSMSSLDQFVADVKAADPTLVGESDKDKAEIQKLSGEVEGLSKDLPVSSDIWLRESAKLTNRRSMRSSLL